MDKPIARIERVEERKVTLALEGFEDEAAARAALASHVRPELGDALLEDARFGDEVLKARYIIGCTGGRTTWCPRRGGLCWIYCEGCIA